MAEQRFYEQEVAASLFGELQDSLRRLPHYAMAYRTLNRVFLITLDQKTRMAGVRFNGPFAKTDYLLKEHHAPRALRATVNEARVHLRRLQETDEETMAANFLHDWKAVCQFVALVFQTPVPSLLEIHFPQPRKRERGALKAEYLRVIVNRWDATYLYADADTEDAEEVKVFYGGASEHAVYSEWDWSYLHSLLHEDSQLNLVRPKEKDGVLYPELIVYEPDYVVDISAVAGCFESYAHSHLVHLINKIKPAPNSSAIMLGNMASQLLDEALQTQKPSYRESVEKFFASNAVGLLTTTLDADFHAQAQTQQRNIQRLLSTTLPQLLNADHIRFNATDIMVEPSFFSEMLGLQGRMDFLQLDQKVVIEQKSGKSGWPQRDPDTPVHKEQHYVQLLLYMLLLRYNYREQYEKNQRNLHAFLLYSKYLNGLLPLGFAPQLIFEAMKLRNETVAAEFSYTHGAMTVLDTLTPDSLNIRKAKGRLWEEWTRKDLTLLLQPLHRASALERAYYHRFMTFLATEHLMAKVGNQTKESSGFADKWNSPLDTKLLNGNIYCDLELVSPTADSQDRVESVTLRFAQRPDSDISNFRTGDIVILYPYDEGTEPDARRTMVFRATLQEIGQEQITLSLRAMQVNSHVFWHNGKKKWAIEHDFFESSYGALYRGMHAFLSAPQERRDLLLLQRPPLTDPSLTLRGDYGPFNTLALKVRQAQDLFLIIGPPGTGKTSYGLVNTLKEELRSEEASVLLLSYTNRAVDEICSKLVEEELDFIRIGSRFSCEERYRPYLLDAKVRECGSVTALKERVARTRIFVGTTSTFNANANFFKVKQFSLAIIDEASQILEPHLMGILSATDENGRSAIRKIVLIGDHKQLPAVVQQKEEESEVHDRLLNDICLTNCRLSLFERLLKRYRGNPDVVYMLTKQGRMHQDIAIFPNDAFYNGKLQVVPLPHQDKMLPALGQGHNGIDNLLATRRIAFIAVAPPQDSVSEKVNTHEAQAIAATVLRIYEMEKDHFSATDTVGVIVPYRNQIAEVRKYIERSGIDALRGITIDTVERFQGSQRDYILYGFTIQHFYQLDFLTSNVFEEDGCIIDRKLNVAMTRAREHLLLFGNPNLLANDITFSRLMDFVRSRQGFFEPDLSQYVTGLFDVPEMKRET